MYEHPTLRIQTEIKLKMSKSSRNHHRLLALAALS